MKRRVLFGLILSSCLTFIGCKTAQKAEAPDYNRALPPGQYALRKITDPAMMPDIYLACFNTRDLRSGIDKSLSYLSKPSSEQFFPMGDITHERTVASLKALGQLLDSGLYGRDLESAILSQFDFYQSVGCDDRGTVLFTGYYTPIFDGSLTPSDQYKYPLYKQPQDLVKGQNGEILGQQLADGTTRPYPQRREIEESGMLKGQEIAWMADPFEVYIAHVQGSAILRTPDGQQVTLGYTANNGHEYQSVGQQMIKDGAMPAEGYSLKSMIEYFKAHPDQIAKYVYQNPRYVFFGTDSGNPRGCLNECVTTRRTIATDKTIYPRAAISFLKTSLPRQQEGAIRKAPFAGFGLDQDAGGAIRAAGRCDVYMGVGDNAGKMAGQVYEEGKLYYLFVKPGLMTAGQPHAATAPLAAAMPSK
ncbi:MAG: MltA domain-containing protein [Planctomycetaceae bacterium]|nr:MltA domain-containing protein [Planctomycetaceae bacterium]